MKPPKKPASTVWRSGSGDRPSSEDDAVSRRPRVSHQPQGSSTALAPSTRSKPMSNGSSVRPADARPMTMNPVQMATVITAAAMPVARGERRMGGLSAAPRPGIRARGRAEP